MRYGYVWNSRYTLKQWGRRDFGGRAGNGRDQEESPDEIEPSVFQICNDSLELGTGEMLEGWHSGCRVHLLWVLQVAFNPAVASYIGHGG